MLATRFSKHGASHKEVGGRTSLDALACDGGANYAYSTRSGGGRAAAEMKTRGYGKESEAAMAPWILATYPTDRLDAPPPVTADEVPLKVKEAAVTAARGPPRRARRGGLPPRDPRRGGSGPTGRSSRPPSSS